jgi:hypothetical protein
MLGINNFAIALLKITPSAWEEFGGAGINKGLKHPNVIKFYRIPRGQVSHIIVYGFRNMKELNHFFQLMQEQQSRYVQIVNIFTFGSENFGTKSADELIKNVLDNKNTERIPRPEKFRGS